MPALNLSTVQEPKFELQENAESEVKAFDPWDLSAKIESNILAKAGGGEQDAVLNAIREAVEMPKLTGQQCMTIQASLIEFVEGLDVSKKLRGKQQK